MKNSEALAGVRGGADGRMLVRFEYAGSRQYGIVIDGEVYEAMSPLDFSAPVGDRIGSVDDVRLLCPTEPVNVFCAAENSVDFLSPGESAPTRPKFFLKPATAIVGPNEEMGWPAYSSRHVYPTAEIAVVIGTGGHNIAEDNAMSHVLGVTASTELQFDATSWSYTDLFENKCYEGSLVVGPAIVPIAADLPFTCHVDGRLVQSSSLGQLLHGVPRMISVVSEVLTLSPGDLLLCGAAKSMDERGVPLDVNDLARPGSTVRTEVAGVGRLENGFASR